MVYIGEKECSIYKGLRAFRDTWEKKKLPRVIINKFRLIFSCLDKDSK